MADNIMKCPICGQETSGRFCESCGFELHVLPEGVSEEVKQYENERVERHKKAFEGLQKLQEFEGKSIELEELSKQQQTELERLQEFEGKAKELEELSKKQKTELERLQEFEGKAKELEELSKKQKTELERLQEFEGKAKELEELSKNQKIELERLQACENENLQLRKDLDEAKRKATENKDERPKAFILLSGGGDEAVGAVYSGRNTYGCLFGDINDPNHQELNITGLKPRHFGIEMLGDRFLLVDYVGDITNASGTPAGSKGLSLLNGSRINIGNSIKGTFIITI